MAGERERPWRMTSAWECRGRHSHGHTHTTAVAGVIRIKTGMGGAAAMRRENWTAPSPPNTNSITHALRSYAVQSSQQLAVAGDRPEERQTFLKSGRRTPKTRNMARRVSQVECHRDQRYDAQAGGQG